MLSFLLVVLRTVLLDGRERGGVMQKLLMVGCFLLMLQGVHGILMELLKDYRQDGHRL